MSTIIRFASRLLLLLVALATVVPPALAQQSQRSFLIKLTPEAERATRITASKQGVTTGVESVDALHRTHQVVGMERVFRDAGKFEARHREFGLHRWYVLKVEGREVLDTMIGQYRLNQNIEAVDQIRSRKMLGRATAGPTRASARSAEASARVQVPNDPQYQSQWQYNAPSDADIDLAEAWDLSTGSSNVVVAVLDSGADLDHPDLAANLWVNAGEIAGNGIDDDNNGFVDDVNGWDFSDGDNNPDDADGHGTHTAGTIAAATNNGVGVAGVAGGFNGGGARVMPLKIFENAVDDIIANAFVYAADNGAVISSNSWGGGDQSSLIENAIDYFIANAGGPGEAMQGGLVVFATGNDGSGDPSWGYPASYTPVMGVAASDQSDRIPNWSNYGAYVDIAAPGEGIISTVVGGYDSYDGTSMATPHVAGVAALVASYAPGLTAAAVRQILEDSADNIDSLNPTRVGQFGSGRLNAFAALSAAVPPAPDNTAPGAISSLAISGATYASLDLRWVATGDDGDAGRAARYDIRYSTSPITEFDSATAASATPSPGTAGTTERFSLTGLSPSTTYYVAVRAVDEAGNEGPIASGVSGTTLAGPSISVNPAALSASIAPGSTGSLAVTLTNTGSSPVNWAASTSTRQTTAIKVRRDVDPRARRVKEQDRPQVMRGDPIVMLSGGAFLVWDPDANNGTGEVLRDRLIGMGHAVDYTSALGNVPDLNTYDAVFVTLGMFPDNHVLTAGQGNTLASYLDAGGALYMEGGDTWAYDAARAVHGYFGIEGLDDGQNDLAAVTGVSGKWTEGANWTYTTSPNVADYVDRLSPTGSGLTVLRNSGAGYDVGIALDGGTYRTVGTSFSAGALSGPDLDSWLTGVVGFLAESATGTWLAVAPESGSLAPGASTQLNVAIDATTLDAGTYEGTLTVASLDGALRADVPVGLTVSGDGGTDPPPTDPPPTDPPPTDPPPTDPPAGPADPVLSLDAHDLLSMDGSLISTWTDASGNGHDAFQGGSRRPLVLTGWIGDAPAVVFDGENDYLKITNHEDLNTGGPYEAKTIAIVAETGWDTWDRQVIFEEGGGSRGISIYVFRDQLHLAAWNIPSDGGAGGWGPVVVSHDVEPYVLYTITLRLDGAAGTLDGRVNASSIGQESGAGMLFAHSGKIGLGGMWNATRFHDRAATGPAGFYFSGSIAAVQYYNDVLTDEEASAMESELHGAFYGGTSAMKNGKRSNPATPAEFELAQNYPNPFNPTTSISYTLPEAAMVRLVVFDVLGREVQSLVQSEMTAGSHTAVWNGKDMAGRSVASGTYLYRLTAGNQTVSRTMLLIK